jgi:hypothetical protein
MQTRALKRTSPTKTDSSLPRRFRRLCAFFSLQCCLPACLRITLPEEVTLYLFAIALRVLSLASMAVHTGVARGKVTAAVIFGAALIPQRFDESDSACRSQHNQLVPADA